MKTISINDYKRLADKIAGDSRKSGIAFIVTAWGMISVLFRKGGTPNVSDLWCDITSVKATMDDYPSSRLVSTDLDASKLENMVLQSMRV